MPPARPLSPAYTTALQTYFALREMWRDSLLLYVRWRFAVEPTWQQAQILEAILPPAAKVTVRSGHGIGKAQPKDLMLDTPTGHRRFGDLRPGDTVFGRNGHPTVIVAVHDRGVLPTYRVVFDDGRSTVVCAQHLWTVHGRHDRRHGLSTWRTLSTADLIALGVKRGNGINEARQWALPDIAPLQYPLQGVPVDPYTLGYWLGDGCGSTAMITTMDEEPLTRIRHAGYDITHAAWSKLTEANAHVYHIRKVQWGLRALGVFDCGARDTFVPQCYKENIPAVREAILQGLLDSDGYVEPAGNPSFCSVSHQLATDVAWLVRSLGGKARISGGTPKCSTAKDGQKIQGHPAYIVTFAFENAFQPFTIARKALRYRPTSQKRSATRWMETITPEGLADCQCITVANPDGLYVTNDCIVTHNSSAAAWIITWFLETHDYAKVPCTAPSSHQLRDVLWGELSKWRRRADEVSLARGEHPRFWLSKLFKLTTDSFYDPGAREWGAIARTARKENPEALQGFHATHLLFVLDEASGIPEPVFEAAEGALSTPAARVLLLSNATRTSGTFYDSHHTDRSAYLPLHFTSQESPLVAPGYRARLVRKWGEGSNVVRVRADGEFPRQEDDILISLELTEPCLTRERCAGEGLRKLGVDVARFGRDRTTLVLRQGRVVEHVQIYAKQDTMETVGRVLVAFEQWQADEIDVDVIGIGAGVYDRLVEVMVERRRALQRTGLVVPVNVADAAPPKVPVDEFQAKGMRDYLWMAMARWLRDETPVFAAADREACHDLAGELASTQYRIDSNGRLVVEDKDAMRKRLGHSPDLADALGCTFVPPAPTKRAGAWGRR